MADTPVQQDVTPPLQGPAACAVHVSSDEKTGPPNNDTPPVLPTDSRLQHIKDVLHSVRNAPPSSIQCYSACVACATPYIVISCFDATSSCMLPTVFAVGMIAPLLAVYLFLQACGEIPPTDTTNNNTTFRIIHTLVYFSLPQFVSSICGELWAVLLASIAVAWPIQHVWALDARGDGTRLRTFAITSCVCSIPLCWQPAPWPGLFGFLAIASGVVVMHFNHAHLAGWGTPFLPLIGGLYVFAACTSADDRGFG